MAAEPGRGTAAARRASPPTRDLDRRALAYAGQPVGDERGSASLHEPATGLAQLVGGGLPHAFPCGGRRDLDVGGLRWRREALVDVHVHAQVVGHPLTGLRFGEAERLEGHA